MGRRSNSRSRSRDNKRHKDNKDRKERKRSHSREKKKYDKDDKPLREKPAAHDNNNDKGSAQTENATQKVEQLWEKIKEEKQAEQESLLKVQQKYGIVKKTERQGPVKLEGVSSFNPVMIEVIINDRLGKKERIKCLPSDTIGVLKKLIQFKTGTRADKVKLQKWHQVFKDHITLEDYEIHDGQSLEMYYN